jgi:YD repeat-containing protein
VVTDGILSLANTFNGYGEVKGQDFTLNGNNISSWSLFYNDAGRITQKTEIINGNTSIYTYTYDPPGQLLMVSKDGSLVEEYQYGPNGTRTYEMNTLRGISGRVFIYSDEDHLLTAGETTNHYNVDGFLAEKKDNEDVSTYEYSSSGELLRVKLPDSRMIEYIHDPLGRRIAKKVNGAVTEKYLWQGLTRLLAVYNGSDNLLIRFEYADARMSIAMTIGGSKYYFRMIRLVP